MEEEAEKKEVKEETKMKKEKEKSVESSKASEGKEEQSSNMKEEPSEKLTDESVEDSKGIKKISKKDREIYWVFGIMLALIAVFLISFSVFDGSKKFDYNGLTFTKESFGEIPVYHHFYYYSNPGITGSAVSADVIKYNLYLRIDPRENDVPASGEIFLSLGYETYISVNPIDLTQCEYSSVAIANLAAFLVDNQVPVKSASPNKTMAEEAQAVYATCDTHPENAVIIIESGPASRIYKENDNCYIISVADCEVLEATEKFITKSIIDANRRKALNPFLS